jgi:phosphoribosyl-ATP pyrophosphohydrolase
MSASETNSILADLMGVIEQRKACPSANSYTNSLFAAGLGKIGAKIREEADEVIEAAGMTDVQAGRDHLIHECADLIYHLFVLMGDREIRLAEVEAELARRFGISGLDEKAARTDRDPHE